MLAFLSNYRIYKMKLHIIDSSLIHGLLNRAINRDSEHD